MLKKILIFFDKNYKINIKKSDDMNFNALKINPKMGIVEKIKLPSFKESCIEKNIKKFSFLPLILEKIMIDYDSELTMLTEIKDIQNKKNKVDCFYFKGYPIGSSAVVAKSTIASVSYPNIEYSEIENLDEAKSFLDKKVIFGNSGNIPNQNKIQIDIIDIICKCNVNPFEIITFHDKKYSLKTLKIIDIIDIVVAINTPTSVEILKSMMKTLKVIEGIVGESPSQKYIMCINMLQRTCSQISFE